MAQQVDKNAKVKFYFIPKGKTLPSTLDNNTIYFDANNGEIFVGNNLVATNNNDLLENYFNKNQTLEIINSMQPTWTTAD